MDTTIKVQHGKHFKIDPSKLNVGAIVLPETIMTTIVVGEEIISKKVPLNEAFSQAEQEDIKQQLEPLVIKAHQTATSVADIPNVQTPVASAQAIPTAPAVQEEEESLF